MNNKLTDEALSAYLDGELPPAQHKEVQRLIEASPTAQAQLEELRKLSGLIQETPRAQLPQEFADQVLQLAERRSLLAEPEPPRAAQSQRSWWRPALGVSVAAAAVFALTTLLPPPQEQDNFERLAQQTEPSLPAIAPSENAVVAEKDDDANGVMDLAEPLGVAGSNSPEPANVNLRGGSDSALMDDEQAKPSAELQIGTRVKLPADREWNRERIGEVINAVTVDKSGSRVAVIEVAVVDIQQWVWGIEVLLQKGPLEETRTESDVVAVYVKASEQAVTEAIAKLHTDGVHLLGMELAEPIEIAELPLQQQQQFFAFNNVLTSEADEKKRGLLTSPLNRSQSDAAVSPNVASGKNVDADSPAANTKGDLAKRRSSKRSSQLAEIADNIFVPRISARQLARKKQEAAEAEKIGVIKPAPPAKEFADEPDKNSKGSKMVRIIFLVQRVADKSTNPAPNNEQPPDGGGAA